MLLNIWHRLIWKAALVIWHPSSVLCLLLINSVEQAGERESSLVACARALSELLKNELQVDGEITNDKHSLWLTALKLRK